MLHPFNQLRRFRRSGTSRFGLEQRSRTTVVAFFCEQLTPIARTTALLERDIARATWTTNVTLGWLIF
ncbi:MAG TPA: hypothetical protein VGJ56_04980 [Reyranella sp.]